MPGAFLATNLIATDLDITVDSEDDSYPRANLYDKQAANVFKCDSQTSLTIEIDLGGPWDADTIALINHNLTDNATLVLTAGSSPSPSTGVAVPVYRARDLWKAFTLTTARYWLLTITDANPAIIQIGQLLLGVRTAFPRGRKIGPYSPAVKRSNISGETYAGVLWNYRLFERRQFNPSFRVGTAAELAILQALDDSVHGNLYPFLYIPDGTDTDCFYVRKEQDFEPQEFGRVAAGIVHDYQMTLIEESRGLEILP